MQLAILQPCNEADHIQPYPLIGYTSEPVHQSIGHGVQPVPIQINDLLILRQTRIDRKCQREILNEVNEVVMFEQWSCHDHTLQVQPNYRMAIFRY